MNRLKEILELKGMTQKELADKADVTEVSISRYANGSRIPNAQLAGKIAQILDSSVEELFLPMASAEMDVFTAEADALYVVVGRKPNGEPFFWHYDTPETVGFNTCSFLKSFPDDDVVIRKATPSEIIKYRSDM